MTPEEIQDGLLQFHGTENYYQYMGFVYTEGVAYMTESCKSYWLLDIVSSYLGRLRGEQFVVVKLVVNERSAVVTFDDGNGNLLIKQAIEYTDFPLPEMKLFLCNGVLMLPSEY
jgi:hypothetical protein